MKHRANENDFRMDTDNVECKSGTDAISLLDLFYMKTGARGKPMTRYLHHTWVW